MRAFREPGRRRPAEAGDSGGKSPRAVFRVSEIAGMVRGLLEHEFPDVWIEGEITGFHPHRSGHWYFSLKDEAATLAAVMWRGDNARVRFDPADGLHVLVKGTLTLYEAGGKFQVRVLEMEPRGAGALALAFEQVRRRLEAEGLLDAARKRPLPLLPGTIGVVTSTEGAALRDILKVLARRDARASVLVSPCPVQGAAAAPGILAALGLLARAAREGRIGVAIVARGGGSPEDLWGFNDEAVARAIAAFPVPVVTGIGHEIDTTIADLAADLRAATPSQAAELVAEQREHLEEKIRGLSRSLGREMRVRVSEARAGIAPFASGRIAAVLRGRVGRSLERCDDLHEALGRSARAAVRIGRERAGALARRLSPAGLLSGVRARREALDAASGGLRRALLGRLSGGRARVSALAGRLDALSPLSVLDRGYALVRREADGAILRDAGQVSVGEGVEILLRRGRLGAVVRETTAGEESLPRERG